MKFARLVVLLVALSLLATACDSQSLLEALLGGSTVVEPSQPVIITATPPPTVIVSSPTPAADAIVATRNMNIRYGPGTVYAPPVGVLNEGTPLTVLGKNCNCTGRDLWLKVVTPTGLQGWVAAWLLTVNLDVNLVPVVPVPPTPTPLPPTLTPTPSGPIVNFFADKVTLSPGECTTIRWDVQNVQAVYYQGVPVVGQGSSVECPGTTTTYQLSVIFTNGVEQFYTVTLIVGTAPYVNYRADRYAIGPSECTTIRWDVEGVSAVYFQGVGVGGHSSQLVCPGTTTTYTLRVVNTDSSTNDYFLTIYVSGAYGP
ncbi:MAG: hypothetical protein Kow00120_21240 [Anaerolineae bacterium]